MLCLLLYGFSGRLPPAVEPEPVGPGWVPLARIRERFGLELAEGNAEQVVLTGRGKRLTFAPGWRRLQVEDLSIWLNAPLVLGPADWLLSAADVESTLRPLLAAPREEPAFLRVLLDPGHGGVDGGAVSLNGTLVEKTIVLEIALSVANRLAAKGLAVALTRADDRALSLRERVAIAGDWPADVFVSIHANAAENRHARGAETFVSPADGFPATDQTLSGTIPEIPAGNPDGTFAAQSLLLGYLVHRSQPLRGAHEADRGVRRARFQVLAQAPCPAVLVECGFLSNAGDARELARPEVRDAIARAIAGGILAYARRVPLYEPEH